MNIQPTREEFCRLAATYNIIPVFAEVATDLETPVSIYYKLVGDDIGFMLESAEIGKNFGRYSFVGCQPFAVFTARGGGVDIHMDGERRQSTEKPLDALQAFIGEFKAAPTIQLPLVAGGAAGYFAYDLVATFERVRGYAIPDDLLLAQLLFCQELAVVDHLRHSSRLVVMARLRPGHDAGSVYDEAVRRLEDMKNRLRRQQRQAAEPSGAATTKGGSSAVSSNMTQDDYMAMVEQGKEHIRYGDIFQIVLSQRLTAPLTVHPFAMYRRLRRVNPSPYMFYFNFGDRQLIGASPEMLIKLEDGHLTTRPIAGTRPRGKDVTDDARLAEELLADVKERAEHVMLVDLGRNDLGRVCVPGTVKIERYMQVEMYSHVMHIVSDVGGTVKDSVGAVDALKACFPAGTLSGAPKVRAMEIIYDMEKSNRGPYGGAVGYIDFSGNMDTCITIRTMTVDNGQVTVQTGAGIVYDSVPATEFAETLHKAGAILEVVSGKGEDA